MTTIPAGYQTGTIPLADLARRYPEVDPELLRRLSDAFAEAATLGQAVGIGDGGRTQEEADKAHAADPGTFATSRKSYHVPCTTTGKCRAADLVQLATPKHVAPPWGSPIHRVAAKHGLVFPIKPNPKAKTARGRAGESWHVQAIEDPASRPAGRIFDPLARFGGSLPAPAPEPAPVVWSPPDGKFGLYPLDAGKPVIFLGAAGQLVEYAQHGLAVWAYVHGDGEASPGTPDGDFGPKTERAVKRVQAREGFTVDGRIGRQTWPVLDGCIGLVAK